MNLNQLLLANAVASTGSFTAAAAKCCVIQPTLSNGIAQLQNKLGVKPASFTAAGPMRRYDE